MTERERKPVPARRVEGIQPRWFLVDVTLWVPATTEEQALQQVNRFVDRIRSRLPRRWNAVVNELAAWNGGPVEEPVWENPKPEGSR